MSNNKYEINDLTLEMSLGVRDDISKLDKLLEHVESIRYLNIKGMLCDCDYNVNYILNRLSEKGIEVVNVNVDVEM